MYTKEALNNLNSKAYQDVLEDQLLTQGVVTAEELTLVCQVAGHNVETLEGILYARTGLHDLEQLLEEVGELEE